MNTASKEPHAATAFSRPEISPSRTLDEIGVLGPRLNGNHSDWTERIDDLLAVRGLEDDWDGEGTAAPDPSLVDGAIALCQFLQSHGFAPPDRVHASVNETVFLEWHTPIGYREIEVLSPMEAESRWLPTGLERAEVFRLSRR